MFNEINEKLSLLEEKVFVRDRVEGRIKTLEAKVHEFDRTLEMLKAKYREEKKDLEAMEKLSFVSLFYSLLGSKDDKRNKEHKEVLDAKLKLERFLVKRELLTDELSSEKKRLRDIHQASLRYDDLLKEKKKIMMDSEVYGSKLRDIERQIGLRKKALHEISEAVRAGEEASRRLRSASETLRSARNWGTYDMFSKKSWISSMVKQDKVKSAQSDMTYANHALERFEKEVEDVASIHKTYVGEIAFSSTVKTFDIWFDNIFTDIHVQRRINRAREDVSSTLVKVGDLVGTLRKKRFNIREEIHRLEEEMQEQIKEAS